MFSLPPDQEDVVEDRARIRRTFGSQPRRLRAADETTEPGCRRAPASLSLSLRWRAKSGTHLTFWFRALAGMTIPTAVRLTIAAVVLSQTLTHVLRPHRVKQNAY